MPQNSRLRIVFTLVLIVLFISIDLCSVFAFAESSNIKIGVLANRGKEQALLDWTATAEYLTEKIPENTFQIIPLDFLEIDHYVKNDLIDYIIVNPAIYIDLENKYGISRILTKQTRYGDKGYSVFSGIIFTKANNQTINQLQDIKGKSFVAVDKTSLGGWLMALEMFIDNNIDPNKDFTKLEFINNQDMVVKAVIEGKYDAGTINTTTLQEMMETKKININDIKILNNYLTDPILMQEHLKLHNLDFPFEHSTKIYPEWPFARVGKPNENIRKKLVNALLDMPNESTAAKNSGIYGWTTPENYQSIHDLAKKLQIAPYENYGKVSLLDWIDQNRNLAYLICGTLLLILVLLLISTVSVSKIKSIKDKLNKYLDISGVLILALNEQGIVTLINKRGTEIMEMTQKEILGKNWIQLAVPKEDKENISKIFKDIIQTGSQDLGDIESKIITKSGKIKNIFWHNTLLKNTSGKNIGLLASGEDITDVKKYQISLEETRNDLLNQQSALLNVLDDVEHERQMSENIANDLKKFQMAVDNASEQMIITDPEGIILYANEATKIITGYSDSEIIGKKAGTITTWGGHMDKEFYKLLWKTIKTDKKTFRGYINNTRKNGTEYIADIRVSPILDINGNVIFFVGIEQDSTKEREIDKMKTEFISLASHQLRTPLSAIKWFLELLQGDKKSKFTKEQTEYVNNIQQSNDRMIELVNALLNISRIESGRIIIDPKLTDIKDLVEGIFTELQNKMTDKKLKLFFKISNKLPKIKIDPKLIRNAYMNLLTNSIKYTPKGGQITVDITEKDGNLLAKFSDTGYGIPSKDHDHVFKKFYRGDNITKIETDGNGLGLYLVKSIVDAANGKIWFESEENKGTTFWITIPMTGMKAKKGEVTIDA